MDEIRKKKINSENSTRKINSFRRFYHTKKKAGLNKINKMGKILQTHTHTHKRLASKTLFIIINLKIIVRV